MKTVNVLLIVVSVILFCAGCTKKNETEANKKDSTITTKKDSITQSFSDNQKEEPGYYKTNIPFEEYLKQHPNLNKKIEFEDIIETLALNKYVDNDKRERLQNWTLLADKNTSPVNWLSRAANGKKTGELILLFNGKPAEILDKYIMPVIWEMTLKGTNDGINKINFSSDILTKSVNNLDIPSLMKKKNIIANLLKATGDISNGEKDFKLVISNKEPIWMAYSWSCGSGGCSADFNIYYNENLFKTETEKVKVP